MSFFVPYVVSGGDIPAAKGFIFCSCPIFYLFKVRGFSYSFVGVLQDSFQIYIFEESQELEEVPELELQELKMFRELEELQIPKEICDCFGEFRKCFQLKIFEELRGLDVSKFGCQELKESHDLGELQVLKDIQRLQEYISLFREFLTLVLRYASHWWFYYTLSVFTAHFNVQYCTLNILYTLVSDPPFKVIQNLFLVFCLYPNIIVFSIL